MNPYPKIQSVYMRNMEGDKSLIEGAFVSEEFEYLSMSLWEFTEKVDGMNIRVMYDGEKVTFGGKTDSAVLPQQLLSNLHEMFSSKLELFSRRFQQKEVCFYGEGYGDKIQSVGKLYSPVQNFVMFDVKIGDVWLPRNVVNSIAEEFGVQSVPVIGRGTLYDMTEMAKRGITSRWGDFQAEGIVARPIVELRDRFGSRIITKLKTMDFVK